MEVSEGGKPCLESPVWRPSPANSPDTICWTLFTTRLSLLHRGQGGPIREGALETLLPGSRNALGEAKRWKRETADFCPCPGDPPHEEPFRATRQHSTTRGKATSWKGGPETRPLERRCALVPGQCLAGAPRSMGKRAPRTRQSGALAGAPRSPEKGCPSTSAVRQSRRPAERWKKSGLLQGALAPSPAPRRASPWRAFTRRVWLSLAGAGRPHSTRHPRNASARL